MKMSGRILGTLSKKVLACSAGLMLSACGVTYNAQTVQEAAGDIPVRIVGITGHSLLEANGSAYTPRQLPAEFRTGAGGGSGVRSAAVMPQPPAVPSVTMQRSQLRPPPSAEAGPYLIGVGDVIDVLTRAPDLVTGEPAGDLANHSDRSGYTVRDDGAIALPGVGSVQVAGLTLDERKSGSLTNWSKTGLIRKSAWKSRGSIHKAFRSAGPWGPVS